METGIQIEPMFGFTFDDIKAIAQQGEAAGFTHLWVTDHFFLRPDQPQTNCLESWTLLSALAQVTSRLRLGTLVTCQSYRPPSLVAKIAAGLDVMSGGRLELGIGAGWKEVEYRAYGIPFPPAGIRIAQLVDALRIIRAMWTEERATYRGRHYSIEEALCAPKPLQRPHPPILVGGLRPRLMRVQARYANAVNFTDFFLSPDRYAEKVADLRSACEQVGRPFDEIRKTHSTYTIIGRTKADVDRLLDELSRTSATPQQWKDRIAGSTVGTPEHVVERVRGYRDAGASQVIFLFPYRRELEMSGLIAEHVLPHV